MRIGALLEQRGMQQLQLADAMGVSAVAVNKWVSGQAYPSADKLPQLARLLNCTIDELFDGEPPGGAPGEGVSA